MHVCKCINCFFFLLFFTSVLCANLCSLCAMKQKQRKQVAISLICSIDQYINLRFSAKGVIMWRAVFPQWRIDCCLWAVGCRQCAIVNVYVCVSLVCGYVGMCVSASCRNLIQWLSTQLNSCFYYILPADVTRFCRHEQIHTYTHTYIYMFILMCDCVWHASAFNMHLY